MDENWDTRHSVATPAHVEITNQTLMPPSPIPKSTKLNRSPKQCKELFPQDTHIAQGITDAPSYCLWLVDKNINIGPIQSPAGIYVR